MKQIHRKDSHTKHVSLTVEKRKRLPRVVKVLALTGVGLGLGIWFSTADLREISQDFYGEDRVTLTDVVDLTEPAPQMEIEQEKKELRPSAPSASGSAEGGDPRAVVQKKRVLGIISSNSAGSGKGGYASGIDAVLQGTGGVTKGASSSRRASAGIGFGTGTGSGFGGSSGGTDDLLSSLMGGGGSSVKMKCRRSTRTYQPQVSSNEEYVSASVPGMVRTVDEPLSTFSIDVDAASYSNVRRIINTGALPPKGAIRVEEMINYFTYDYPQPKGKHPFSITTELSQCPWNEDAYLAHIGIQGKKIAANRRKPSNLVFLLDVSGSMASPQKLPLVIRSLKMLADQMTSEDRISIAVYAGNAGAVLAPTSGANKQAIKGALNRLNAGGSTAGGAGIRLAYNMAQESFIKGGNNRVIIATDGDFNVGVSSADELTKLIEARRDKGIFLSVLGFGSGNYKDHRMEQLANKGNGNYAYIDNILEAKKVLVTEMQSTLFTIAKDVKIQVEFNPATVAGYRLIGYENRRLAKEDFNDDKKDAGELGAGHTVTALYEIIPAGKSVTPGVDPLKYQKAKPVKKTIGFDDELFTVKFRYKKPQGTKSILLTDVVKNRVPALDKSSDNFRWSVAVSSFGTILNAPHEAEGIAMSDVIKMARDSKGKDQFGYRAEFIRLAEQAELLINERYGMSSHRSWVYSRR